MKLQRHHWAILTKKYFAFSLKMKFPTFSRYFEPTLAEMGQFRLSKTKADVTKSWQIKFHVGVTGAFLHFDNCLWSKITIYTLCVPLEPDLDATVKSLYFILNVIHEYFTRSKLDVPKLNNHQIYLKYIYVSWNLFNKNAQEP